ncbi:MAG: SGNH/GDSL hydrolase family protein [Pseudomonadota bacterium]|nr:SGNH/GDSL hydrolase family protein [Pseudomonadota bacterium]
MRKWLTIAAGNIALLTVLLALLDLALRFTPFDQARQPAIDNPPNYMVADPELGVTHARNFPRGKRFHFRGPSYEVWTNELGCFDEPAALTGAPYIVAIGDSFTWGYNPLEKKWASRIERETGVRVLKCGMNGTGTRHQIIRLKRILAAVPYPPSLIIHLYDTTDFNDDFTFPSETVIAGQRVEDFTRIRLADGKRDPLTEAQREEKRKKIYDGNRDGLQRSSVLYSMLQIGLFVDKRVETRRLVTEGYKPEYLEWKYQFNLQLLDPADYPAVERRFEAHLENLRQMRELAVGTGSAYALFHTNSFRLPDDRPLVKRLKAFLESSPNFLGWMPELDKHLFDPHWRAESEGVVAKVMLERLKARQMLPQAKVTAGLR